MPDTDVPPASNPEFFGNTIMVNGATWPCLDVERRRYRLRLLNGCQARFLLLDFARIPDVEVWQIGNEGGFLERPYDLRTGGQRLLLAPAERADVIVDFTRVPLGNHVLGNVGPDEPFGGGTAGIDYVAADPATTGQVLQFRVGAATKEDKTTPPRFLALPPVRALPAATVTRRLALLEESSKFFEDRPVATLLGTVDGDPNTAAAVWSARMWSDDVTENPEVGATELWEIYNATVDAHPIHVHEVTFQLVNRQPISVDEAAGTVRVVPGSTATPPRPGETGYKDTVIALPGEVTRIRAQLAKPGQSVWHCHIVEHEDNEMMRPFRVGPSQPGQPG